jgi:hypothetical protein
MGASVAACLGRLVIILAFQARTWPNSEQTKLTDQQAREILNRELPVGTDKSRAKQLLRREGLGLFRGETRLSRPWSVMHSRNGLIRTDIRIQFFFDSNGKLVSCEIKTSLANLEEGQRGP